VASLGGAPETVLMHEVWQGEGAYDGPTGPEVVCIQVTNHRRAALSVERAAVHCGGGVMVFVPEADGSALGCPID